VAEHQHPGEKVIGSKTATSCPKSAPAVGELHDARPVDQILGVGGALLERDAGFFRRPTLTDRKLVPIGVVIASVSSGPVPSPGMSVTRCGIGARSCLGSAGTLLALAQALPPVAFSFVDDFRPGLEGVIAFETEIAEPDKEGSALRYRGVDIEELVGQYAFEKVWGLLVDDSFEPGMPRAERIELQDPSGSVMADLQAGLATLGPKWGLRQLVDIGPEDAHDDLARLSAAALSIVSQAARGNAVPVPESEVEQGENAAAQFLIRWRGEADPRHVTAIDTYWVSAAEHGLNASTFTARIAASTGADCAAAMSAAVGALSGPLHGGAPTRVLKMLDEVEERGDAAGYVQELLERGERIMGFGHRVYRAEDPRARVLRRTAHELGSRRVEAAEALEEAARSALRDKSPDRVLETNVEFWAAVVLEVANIPPEMYPAMFACARVAGWSAHIVEERRTGRLIRPSARYVGRSERSLAGA
jgi:citrate synthase